MESKFQFTNPVLKGMNFEMNPEFTDMDNEEMQIRQSISVEIMPYEGKNETTVALKFELGEKSNLCPFYMTAIEQANFRWEDVFTADQVNRFLNQNAPSLLLSYLRPIVSQVTSASPVGAFNIPFMSFVN